MNHTHHHAALRVLPVTARPAQGAPCHLADTERIVYVVVQQRPGCAAEEEDRNVAGRYTLRLAADVPLSMRATAALDSFHADVPIDTLDSFEIYVVDAATSEVLVEAEDAQSYVYCDCADVEAKSPLEATWTVATLRVLATDSAGNEHVMGSLTLAGADRDALESLAISRLWSDRLVGYSPRVVEIDPADDPLAQEEDEIDFTKERM